MRVPRLALVAAVALTLAACGGDEDEGSEATGTPIERLTISLVDFKLDPASVAVDEPGTYALRVVNDGDTTHALEVEGGGDEVETAELAPGASEELTVEVEAGQEYELYCPIGNHRDLGMEGTLSSGGSTTEDEQPSSGGYGS